MHPEDIPERREHSDFAEFLLEVRGFDVKSCPKGTTFSSVVTRENYAIKIWNLGETGETIRKNWSFRRRFTIQTKKPMLRIGCQVMYTETEVEYAVEMNPHRELRSRRHSSTDEYQQQRQADVAGFYFFSQLLILA